MKKIFIIFIFSAFTIQTKAQKALSEGTVTYNMSVEDNADATIANTLNSATLTLYTKGLMIRTDFKSNLVNQSIIFNGKENTATILKELGGNKFLINLTKLNWDDFNQKYNDITFTISNETKNILGYECKKAIATLKNQSTFTVYFAPALTMSNKEYNRQFKGLEGFPLEYESSIQNWKVKYTATQISLNFVPTDKFDLPTRGYRVLEYGKEAM